MIYDCIAMNVGGSDERRKRQRLTGLYARKRKKLPINNMPARHILKRHANHVAELRGRIDAQ